MPAIYKNGIPYTGDSNAASVSVKVSDTTMNMQQLATNLLGDMASVESPTAKAVHAVGEYIVVDGVMYKVTAAIAVGNTITPGTNVTKTTAGAELAALNSRTATIENRYTWDNAFSSGKPVSLPSTDNGAFMLYGYLQGYSQCAVVVISLVNGTITMWDVCGNKTMGTPLSASYSNGRLTLTTSNNAPSRVVLTRL